MSQNIKETKTDNATNGEPHQRRRYLSQAVAFGRTYFHALGGTQERVLRHTEGEPVPAFCWDEPPWRPIDTVTVKQSIANNSKTKTSREKPKPQPDVYDIQQAVCTSQSTLFLTMAGKVYQTGTMHGRVFRTPTALEIPLPLKCVQLAAGRHFCLGRMEGGLAVVSWGAGHFGQLGIGTPTTAVRGGDSSSSPSGGTSSHLVTFTPSPIVIERLLPHMIGSAIASVAAGDWHALALTESGRVWAWGSNRNLQCGRKHHHKQNAAASSGASSTNAPTITVPLPVPLDVPASQIAAGRAHSVAVAKESGQVYCWGSSSHGQCGNSIRRSGIAPPRLVEGMSDLTLAQVAAGGNHTMALTTGGRLFVWGAGSEGELGLGPAIPSQCKPRLVADLDFIAITAGQQWKSQQSRARKEAAAAASKQAAVEKSPPSPDLAKIPRISSIYAGASYSAAVSTTGHVYIWGSNDAGQIGVPTPPFVPQIDGFHMADGKSSLRDLHVRTFDSKHNVLLPIRLDAVSNTNVRTLACGPNHLWCIGEERVFADDQEQPIVGKTLYELQEGQRAKILQQSRNSLRALAFNRNKQDCENEVEDVTESSIDPFGTPMLPPSTPETSIQTMSNPELSSQFGTPDLSAASATSPASSRLSMSTTSLKSPKSEKPSRVGIIRRFSLRRVITRMSSTRSDKDETDNQSDVNESRRGRRRVPREVTT